MFIQYIHLYASYCALLNQQFQIIFAESERWGLLAGQFNSLNNQRKDHQLTIETARAKLETEQKALLELQRARERSLTQSAEFTTRLDKERQREANLLARQARKVEISALLSAQIEQISALNAEKNQLNPAMQDLKKQITALETASGATCPVCGQPLSEADRRKHLEELQAKGKAQGDRFRAIDGVELPAAQQKRRELEAELATLEREDQELRALQRQIAGLEQNLAGLEQQQAEWEQIGAIRLNELSTSLAHNTYATEARAALAELEARIAALQYDSQAHLAAQQAEQAGRTSETRLMQVETARAALQPVERDLAELIASLPAVQAEAQERSTSELLRTL